MATRRRKALFPHVSTPRGAFSLVFAVAMAVGDASAAPVTVPQAERAASAFVRRTYAAPGASRTPTGRIAVPHELSVGTLEPLTHRGGPAGYVARLRPQGFVVMRGDDTLPPVKLHASEGSFDTLPPGFRTVILDELAAEREALTAAARAEVVPPAEHAEAWRSLWVSDATGGAEPAALAPLEPTAANTVLLGTSWNQDSPYNYYAPTAAGGPGGRAYAGCVATAMAQVMRYHQHPAAISSDYSYTDFWGACTGTRSASASGLQSYAWASMPTAITTGSPAAQQQAIGQLIHHAGVAVEMDYEADGSGASSTDVPYALRTLFGYNCDDLVHKSGYTSAAWYAKVAADVDALRPVYYAFRQADGTAGHAVVCDGYRNGNEIHLNLGWSGSGTLWYNIDTVSYGGYVWTVHYAVFGIRPYDATVPTGVAATKGTHADRVGVSWTGVAGRSYYRVSRSTSLGGVKTDLGSWQTGTSYNDTSAVVGTGYHYWVRSATSAAGASASDYSVPDVGYRAIDIATAADTTGLAWTTGGNAAWSGQPLVAHDGTDAAVSGAIGDFQESWAQTTVTGPGTLSFWWKVSSEAGYDFLEFYLDGSRQDGRISGGTEWQQKSYTLAAGTRTLRWRYVKDYSYGDGEDCGWVDQVVFASTAVPSPPTGLVASDYASPAAVSTAWSASAGATHYRVSRATSAGGVKTDLGTWQTATSFVDSSPEPGRTYHYWVRAATSSAGANASAYSASDTGTAAWTVTLVAEDAEAGEPGASRGGGVLRFERNGATDAALTLNVGVSGTAVPDSDYVAIATSVTFGVGTAIATVPVDILDDALVEPEETVVATLLAGATYVVGEPSSATVTVADDELPSSVRLAVLDIETGPGVRLRVGVAGTPATVRVLRSDSPSGPFEETGIVHEQQEDGEIDLIAPRRSGETVQVLVEGEAVHDTWQGAPVDVPVCLSLRYARTASGVLPLTVESAPTPAGPFTGTVWRCTVPAGVGEGRLAVPCGAASEFLRLKGAE